FRFQVSGFRFQVSGFRFQVSGFRFQVSGFRFQVSGFRFQVSGFRFQGVKFGSRQVAESPSRSLSPFDSDRDPELQVNFVANFVVSFGGEKRRGN
ncbi:MAG: hypothetical protein PHO37_05470, partial [Kiritimatiellae bacterium]|nr:hypothetical protein [Kiritimatiellia bacterium]